MRWMVEEEQEGADDFQFLNRSSRNDFMTEMTFVLLSLRLISLACLERSYTPSWHWNSCLWSYCRRALEVGVYKGGWRIS